MELAVGPFDPALHIRSRDHYEAVLREAKSGQTEEARKEAYRRQQELSLEEMPIVPLVNAWLLIAHTDRLQNYVPMRTGFLKTLKDAWLAS